MSAVDEHAAWLIQHQAWMRDVRDPADANAEPAQFVTAGKARAEWEVAHVPSGWTYRVHGDRNQYSGFGTPWMGDVRATRTEAIEAAISMLLGFFDRPEHPEFGLLCQRLRAALPQVDLFDGAIA